MTRDWIRPDRLREQLQSFLLRTRACLLVSCLPFSHSIHPLFLHSVRWDARIATVSAVWSITWEESLEFVSWHRGHAAKAGQLPYCVHAFGGPNCSLCGAALSRLTEYISSYFSSNTSELPPCSQWVQDGDPTFTLVPARVPDFATLSFLAQTPGTHFSHYNMTGTTCIQIC